MNAAARRLSYYTKHNPKAWANVAAIGPQLTDYLDLIVSDLFTITFFVGYKKKN